MLFWCIDDSIPSCYEPVTFAVLWDIHMSQSLLAVLIIGYFLPLSQSLLQCSNSVLTIQALFYGHHDLPLSQSLLQCSNSVLTIQALFHGHHRPISWADCFLLCSKPFTPAGNNTWSVGMGCARLTLQLRRGSGTPGAPPYDVPGCTCACRVTGARRVYGNLS